MNLLDAGLISICGEESFGIGSDHIREKDGIWTILAWLSILANVNAEGKEIVSAKHLLEAQWMKYGRNYYMKHDYEGIEIEKADKGKLNRLSFKNFTLKIFQIFE